MAPEIQLLDCTLRDGGYVNDWKFGSNNLCSILSRLIDSKVDIVEIGFLDERRPFDADRSIMPDTSSVNKIYGKIKKRPPMMVGMIDYGTCGLPHIQPCSDSILDGIRVIFKKYRMHKAMEFCARVKELGYKVFSQLVSITSYTDSELMEVIGLANQVKPYALSIVDTYGLLNPEKLRHIATILDENLSKDIILGFHGHNNLQLAFANTMTFVDEVSPKRDIVVDASLYGMGKSAGNLPIELIVPYLNEKYGKNYSLGPILEAIDESVMDFYRETPWGYKMYFYLCAHNSVHPDYVKQLQAKPDLSVSALDEVLGRIGPEDNKLLYDKEAGEKAFEHYRAEKYDDAGNTEGLIEQLVQKQAILLIGPGPNIALQRDIVERFIKSRDPLIISVNYIPKDLSIDYVFVTKSSRYLEITEKLMAERERPIKIIATSNVESKHSNFLFRFSREPLLEKGQSIADNSMLMLLRLLRRCGVQKVYLAGFDGYSDREDNYFNPSMEYSFIRNKANQMNCHIREVLEKEYANMELNFLTFSRYTATQDKYSGTL